LNTVVSSGADLATRRRLGDDHERGVWPSGWAVDALRERLLRA